MEGQQDYFEPGAEHKHLALHSDEMLALATDEEARIKVIDIQAKAVRWTLKGHASQVVDARFSPDGRRALSRSEDRTIRLWDLENGQMIGAIEPFKEQIASIDFRIDGEQFVVLCEDGAGHIYSSTDCAVVKLFTTQFVEELSSAARIFRHAGVRPALTFTNSRLLLATTNSDENGNSVLRFMDLINDMHNDVIIRPRLSRDLNSPYHDRHDYVVNYDRNCSRIILLSRKRIYGLYNFASNVDLLDTETGYSILTTDPELGGTGERIGCICNFSPNGKFFVLSDHSKWHCYNAADGSHMHQLDAPSFVGDVDVASDGNRVIFAHNFPGGRYAAITLSVRAGGGDEEPFG